MKPVKQRVFGAFIVSVCFLSRVQGSIVSTTLIPSSSADISGSSVTPQAVFLHVQGTNGSFAEIFAAIEFDLGLLENPNYEVQSAVLNLLTLGSSRSGTGSKSFDVFVHGYDGDNQITTSDASVDNLIAGPYQTSWGIGDPIWPDMSSIDVTDLIQTLLYVGANSAGFVLKPENYVGTGFLSLSITSAPSIFGSSRYPELTIVQIPEPASIIMFLVVPVACSRCLKLNIRR